MAGEARSSGLAVPIVLAACIAAAVFVFNSFDNDPTARASPSAVSAPEPTPGPTPVELPTTVLVGAELDEATGQVAEPQQRFDIGSAVAFSAWLGQPLNTDHVSAALARLGADGFHKIVDLPNVPIDATAPYISGVIPGDVASDHLTPGTYLVDLAVPEGERIGYGLFQVGTDIPERIEIFEGFRQVRFEAGNHTGYRIDPLSAEIVAEKPASLNGSSAAPASYRATFDGHDYLFIAKGVWADYYVAESEQVRLAE